MNLDPKTIMMMNIIGSLLMSVSLFVVSKGYLSQIKEIKRCAVATLIQFFGWIFVAALRGVIPDILSILIGNTLLLLSLCLYFNILESFNNKKLAGYYIYLLVVIEFFLLIYFTSIAPNVSARIGVITLCSSLVMFASVYILLFHKEHRPTSHILTASFYLFCAIILSIRSFYSFFIDTDPNRLPYGNNPLEISSYITFFITSVMSTFCFVLMCNDKYAFGINQSNDKIGRNEKQLNDAQEIAKIGSWNFNLLNNELFWSKEHYRIFELTETAPDKLYQAYRSKIHPDDIVELDRLLNLAIEQGLGYEYEHRVICKNGSIKYVLGIAKIVKDSNGKVVSIYGTLQDKTELKVNELGKELLTQISISFNAKNDYLTAAKELCKSISKFGKFDWVELWTPNLEKSQIQLISHYVALINDESFYDYLPDITSHALAESLAGMVWANGEPLILDNIENNKSFVRGYAAKQIGLKAVIGIPLIFNDEVVGVMKIGTKYDANYLKNHIPIFEQLEVYIGSELNRKKLENDLGNLFNTVPGIICILDLKGRFLKINKAGSELIGYSENAIIYHTIEEFVHPRDKGIFTNKFRQLENDENDFKFENRFITQSGDIIWLSWNCKFVVEQSQIYATAKNITQEKKLTELNRYVGIMAKIGSWEVDLENQTVFWSNEVHDLHETDANLFTPNLETAINFYRDDFKDLVQSKVGNCISTGEAFDFEAVIITAKKKEVWVRAIGNAVYENGLCVRFFGSFQDINDRKESENRLLAISDNLPGVIYQYVINADGTDSIKNISGDVEQLWGYTKEEVLKNITPLWEQIRLGGSMDLVKSSILESIETKSNWTCSFKIVMPSGELRTHLGKGTPVFMADGSIVFNVMILDVTKEAKNEILLNQVTKIARIGSWELGLINQNVDSMFWSPMLREILEVDDSFIPSFKSGLAFYIGHNKEKVEDAFSNLITEGLPFEEEILLRTAKGNEQWVRVIGKSETVNNKRIKVYGSFQDIHALKIAELEREKMAADLIQRNRSIEQFTFIISHNLRAPTSNVIGLAELLKDETLSEQQQKELLNGLSTSATALDRIINDINNILKLKSDINHPKETVIFSTLVNDITISISSLIDKNKVILNCDFTEVDNIFSLRIYLHSIFYNLISNSIKYAKPDQQPLIEIKSKKESKNTILTFKDNGLGIDMKTKGSKVFGLYNRFHNHVEGKGIGLFMVKTQVESLGGKISVTSEPNEGTEFTIVFEN